MHRTDSKKSISIVLKYFALLFVVVFLSTSCQKERVTKSPAEIKADLDTLVLDVFNKFPLPGFAIAVVVDSFIYYKTIGHTQIDRKNPFTDRTVFFMGSISEPMVAAIIMRMVQEQKISLDDPVIKYLQYFKIGDNPNNAVTIRHLLTHTSGIPLHSAAWDMPNYEDNALEATTRSIGLQPPEFTPPGSRIMRCAYNYDILADLISKVYGTSFEEVANKIVLEPMEMHSSTFMMKYVDQELIAKPHIIKDWLNLDMKEDEMYPYNREHSGSIGLHTSIKDVANWISMLINRGKTIAGNSFIDGKRYDEMMKPQFKAGNTDNYIGLGWEIEKKGNGYIYKKNNSLSGFRSNLIIMPNDKIGVFVFSNVAENINPEAVGNKIITYLLGEGSLDKFKIPVSIALGRKFASTKNIDSTIQFYCKLKQKNSSEYLFDVYETSRLGINLLLRASDLDNAISFFEFCTREFPTSAYAQLNLAEAYIFKDDIISANRILNKINNFPEDTIGVSERIEILDERLRNRAGD